MSAVCVEWNHCCTLVSTTPRFYPRFRAQNLHCLKMVRLYGRLLQAKLSAVSHRPLLSNLSKYLELIEVANDKLCLALFVSDDRLEPDTDEIMECFERFPARKSIDDEDLHAPSRTRSRGPPRGIVAALHEREAKCVACTCALCALCASSVHHCLCGVESSG